ncbi:MAG: hypothetical protein ABWX61_06565 [Paenisporosarcina sp.]
MNLRAALSSSFMDRDVANDSRKKMNLRRDVSGTYKKHSDFYQTKTPKLSDLEDLLLGKMELDGDTEEVADAVRVYQEIEQQPKHTLAFGTAPIQAISGSTPEETIQLLEHVRRAALASAKPTDEDLRIAANASTRIQQAQAQVDLNEIAESQIEFETQRQKEMQFEATNNTMQVDFQEPQNIVVDRQKQKQLRLFEEAISKYSFHVQMKQQGFTIKQPSFYRIA